MNLLFAAISKRTASRPARPLHAMARKDKGRRSTSQTRRAMSSSSRGHQSASRRDQVVAPVPDSRVYSKAPGAFGHAETPSRVDVIRRVRSKVKGISSWATKEKADAEEVIRTRPGDRNTAPHLRDAR